MLAGKERGLCSWLNIPCVLIPRAFTKDDRSRRPMWTTSFLAGMAGRTMRAICKLYAMRVTHEKLFWRAGNYQGDEGAKSLWV